ncbi:MAG: magnesium transporter [Rhodobiaceae bacterium]|nr:magnesium transporter [Rhodobiaceae bacterium]
MTDLQPQDETIETAAPEVQDEAGHISDEFLENVRTAIEAADASSLREQCADLHEADVGDLVERLTPDERVAFIMLLGADFDFATLTEVDDTIREQILSDLPNQAVAEGVAELEADDAVYILEDLEGTDQKEILSHIPEADRVQIQRGLEFPEESAGRLMSTDFIAVPPFWTVGRTIDHMREADDLPDEFYEIFVVDPSFRPLGTVSLNHILRSKRPTTIEEIMDSDPSTVPATEDQEEVARMFERYNLVSAAVLDKAGRLAGVITIDDVVDVIQYEAEEDIRALAGVGDEEISDSILYTTGNRFTWLLINLGTAILASLVIGLFDATLQQMVALAVLMPIVASMGGNAGTQTMTVAVRALATRDLAGFNVKRIVWRETMVGLINGVAFALIIGAVSAIWFGNVALGGVLAAAMIINMICAGLFGILIPVGLQKFGADPAVASSVFVTTVTDVVGFFAFLGLAAALLL